MNVKIVFQLMILMFSLHITQHVVAQPTTEPLPPTVPGKYEIAIANNAEVFYRYSQNLPSVVNYFTELNEQEIVEFYQEKYGEFTNKAIKRDRLMLYFSHAGNDIRIIVSSQNKKRQVDVMLK